MADRELIGHRCRAEIRQRQAGSVAVVRIEREAAAGDRFVELALVYQRDAQVVMGGRVVEVAGESQAIACDRLLELDLRHEGGTEVTIELCPPCLLRAMPEKMAVEPFSSGMISGVMMAQCAAPKSFGERGFGVNRWCASHGRRRHPHRVGGVMRPSGNYEAMSLRSASGLWTLRKNRRKFCAPSRARCGNATSLAHHALGIWRRSSHSDGVSGVLRILTG